MLATPAALRALSTRTMISYKLVQNSADLVNFLPRIFKYHKRGFRLLVPHAFDRTLISVSGSLDDVSCLVEALSVRNSAVTRLCDTRQTGYGSFLLNNDSFEMRRKFVEMLGL